VCEPAATTSLAAGFFVLGGGLVLVGIALIGQIYNLSGRQADAVLLWWVLILPAGYLLPSIPVVVLGWLGAAAWYMLLLLDRSTWLGLDVHHDPPLGMIAVAAAGALMWALGVLHGEGEYRRVRQFGEQIGLLAIGGALFPLGIFGDHAWWTSAPAPRWPITVLALLALAVLALAVAPVRLPPDRLAVRIGPSAALLLVVLYLFAAVVALATRAPAGTFRLLGWIDWALLFGVALALILYGARWDRTSWINGGIVWIGADALTRYIELFGSMLQTSALFFVTGIFVLLLGWGLERLRRRMTARAAAFQRTP